MDVLAVILGLLTFALLLLTIEGVDRI